VEEYARSAAAVVIAEAQKRVAGVCHCVQTGQASVERGMLHSPIALLEPDKKRKQIACDQAAEAVQREEARKRRHLELDAEAAAAKQARAHKTCRVCPARVHGGGKSWHACPCKMIVICPTCKASLVAVGVIAGHLGVCSTGDAEEGA